jgi:iron complex outermembrane receptor protein
MNGRACCTMKSTIASVMALMVLVGMTSVAQAQSKAVFDLPAQPLADSLRAVGSQTNINLLFDPPLVAGKRAPALKAEVTADEALTRLLVETGIKHEFLNETTIVLAKADAVASKSGKGGVSPSAASGDPGKDDPKEGQKSADTFRVAQVDQASAGPQAVGNEEQNSEKKKKEEGLTEIVVTGTHIRGAGAAASPTYTLIQSDFAAAGVSSVQDALRLLPENFSGGMNDYSAAVSSTRNGAEQNISYGSSINLRGLGNSSTLVLLNGRRIAPGGTGAAVDVSTIPLSALQRIDVVTDGASAIYGSDAVGGVVNLVLRDGYDGAETTVKYGGVTSGHLRQTDINQLFGQDWHSGSAFIDFDYDDQGTLLASDRGYAYALATGPTDLIPESKRWSALFHGHQELGPLVNVGVTAYYTHKAASDELFNPFSLGENITHAHVRQAGGTGFVDIQLPRTWLLELAETYSRTDSDAANGFQSASSPASSDSVGYLSSTSSTEFTLNGSLADLPGGVVKAAVGGEYRRERLDVSRTGFTGTPSPPNLARSVTAEYAELDIPIVGESNAIPLVNSLDLSVAVRHENYSDFGATTNPKVGLVWQPASGTVVNATYGKSFHAPYLSQLDNSLAFGYIDDVTNLASPTGFTPLAIIGQDHAPNLGPERASTFTTGFELKPEILLGADLKVSYFNIVFENRIASDNDNTLLAFTDPSFATRLSLPPNPQVLAELAALPPSQFFNLSASGATLATVGGTLDTGLMNLAKTRVSGVDLTADRRYQSSYGNFHLSINADYLLEFSNKATSNSPSISILNTVYNPVNLKLRGGIDWQRGYWSAATFFNFTNSYRNNQVAPSLSVPSWTTVDASAAYKFGASRGWANGLTLRLSALNVLNKSPPTIIDLSPSFASPGYDTENANPLGRFVSLSVTKGW